MDTVIKEMGRIVVNIFALSEVNWLNSVKGKSETTTTYYSGNDIPTPSKGGGVIVTKEVEKSIIHFATHSDRTKLIKIEAYPVHIKIIQCHSSTADKPDLDINKFYRH